MGQSWLFYVNVRLGKVQSVKHLTVNNHLPDGHGELSRSTFTLSDQKRPALPVSESTFCHAARYTTCEPAAGQREENIKKKSQSAMPLFYDYVPCSD